jgi:arylsulfatase A-like enzyme
VRATDSCLFRHARLALAVAFVLAAPVWEARAQAARVQRRPNFVVILADDLGYGDLGVFGHRSIRTPHIDRMAAEGVRLTEYYSGAPSCTPARVALLTGRYPRRSGLTRVLVPKEKWGLPDSEITLAEVLQQRGYATGIIGKWHLGGRKPFRPRRHGFDSFFGLLYSNDMTLLPLVKWPRLELLRNDKTIESPARVKTLTRRYTEEAVRFISDHKQQPFFLYLAHTMPHIPLRPSDAFKGRSAHGVYGDVVEEIDWSTGEILKAIVSNGLDETTLVIFTSDNGPWLGGVSRGQAPRPSRRKKTRGSTGVLRGAKGTTWEGGVRVPFIARWPGTISAGLVREGIAAAMDVFSTIIAEAGGEAPADRAIDGHNIMPFLQGRAESPRKDFYYYFRDKIFAVRSGRWKVHFLKRNLGPKGKPRNAVRCQPPELYDLSQDPGERSNVAAEHPEIVERLAKAAAVFHSGIKPVLHLPPASSSVFSGLVTQAPKGQRKQEQESSEEVK